jgi:hypothetical protein
MNWTVDTPVHLGDSVIAAIVEFKISVNAVGPGLAGWAKKTPLLFIQFRGDRISGLDINGHAYEADEIELLYPTAIAQIHAMQHNLS